MSISEDYSTIAVITYLGDGVGNCKCKKCNKSINRDDNYCKGCGRKIIGYELIRRNND